MERMLVQQQSYSSSRSIFSSSTLQDVSSSLRCRVISVPKTYPQHRELQSAWATFPQAPVMHSMYVRIFPLLIITPNYHPNYHQTQKHGDNHPQYISLMIRPAHSLGLICLFSLAFLAQCTSREAIFDFFNLVIENKLKLQLQNTSCTESCCASLSKRAPMTFYYYQNTGRFRGGSGQFAINTLGYSGQGSGHNNPAEQCVVNTGPLPATTYKLGSCQNVMHNTVQRPCSFALVPQKPNEMCGRSDFLVHGCNCCTSQDDTNPPVAGCSAGCVVLSYANRRKLRVGDTLIVEHFQPKMHIEMN